MAFVKRITAIDHELDSIAATHLSKIGPRGESPAELAQRVVKDREAFEWFTDRPARFAAELGVTEQDIAALAQARRRAGDLLDHLGAVLPSPADLPTAEVVRRWHDDLVRAGQLQETATAGPVRTLRITPDDAEKALQLADVLHALASTHPVVLDAAWIEPFRRSAIKGEDEAWAAVLRERLQEWASLDAERRRAGATIGRAATRTF